MRRAETLAARLLLASFPWVTAALLVTGIVLLVLFRGHIERRFDDALADHIQELVAAAEIGTDGAPVLRWTPTDPRFNRPLSGWYWQVGPQREPFARSHSLWSDTLPVQTGTSPGPRASIEIAGPDARRLRAVTQHVLLPGRERPITFTVAGPVEDVARDVAAFRNALAASLGLLGCGLLAGVYLQVRFGLRPLARLRRALAAVRAGREARLPEDVPGEVRPVVEELNALLGHNAAIVERARNRTGDLAHALRNPLAVIANEAAGLPHDAGRVVAEQAQRMRAAVERHLAIARAAGSAPVVGARALVEPVAAGLLESMSLLHARRELAVAHEGLAGLVFRGDAQDLEEMLGNLLDNACKWARSSVCLRGEADGPRLRLHVDDDGPGIAPERREEALGRGTRLDQSVPGTGLGLAITADLAELCGGRVALAVSPQGGLRATLELPGAGAKVAARSG